LCLVWILGASMVMASLDAVPDPPAVNPHTTVVNLAARLCDVPCAFCERRLNSDCFRTSSHHLQIRWIAFISACEPNLPGDWIALTGQAADPSPPILEPGHKLYFQS